MGSVNEGAVHGESLLFQRVQGTSGGFNIKVAEATGTATAATTFSIAVNVPSGAVILGTQMRVDTALTSSDGGTAWSAAFATGSTAACATAVAIAKNSKSTLMFNPFAVTPITSNVTTITVTADSAKTFAAGGVVRAIVYYMDFDAMVSL